MKRYLGGLLAGAVLLVVLGCFSPKALAAPNRFEPGTLVFDNFNKEKTILQPEEGSYWWIDGQGTLPNGDPARVRGEHNCELQTCVQIYRQEDGESYEAVRLTGYPTTTTANYTNANLSEGIDGADGDPVYGGQAYPGPWNPTPGHDVVVETHLKFGPNFHIDGSGGAKGTGGVWLWSNPFSQGAPNPFAIYDGVGFSWVSNDSEILQGMTMMVTKGAFPVYVNPVTGININDWNTFKFVWSQDVSGNQSVTYYVNGTQTGVAQLYAGVTTMQNMGLEVWLDNQAYKPSQYPNYIQRILIPEERHFDIDWVSISKD
ncbi:hypothetical protein A2Z00_01955 [Candidatus Gottesmanbacteria bacterium RBG_13_45_10]|uniref:GH16 domain-containing protein n=1 Tax=Candidatus Gottesmanbacteria bacterium RBG_13_45_10 TaxID=1798370 RepID=A0A1F5ZH16_9BACT|nr:MAG: hypothetical protein A2Z00_01955 [Candidatus Gottesmanbacteria bacterium RBG_13_45_10]